MIGWAGYVPKVCRNTIIGYTPYVWGWPRVFVSHMNKVNISVILVNIEDGLPDGIDDPKVVKELSKGFQGIISGEIILNRLVLLVITGKIKRLKFDSSMIAS